MEPWQAECAKFEDLTDFLELIEVGYDTPDFSVSWWEPRYWRLWAGGQATSRRGPRLVDCLPMHTWLALLRGINVGGRNQIRMAELRVCLEDLGLEAVSTYIQSGNVVFRSAVPEAGDLASTLEHALASAFDYDATVVLRSHDQLQAVVSGGPEGFGSLPDTYRYDVAFLKEPLTAEDALPQVPTRDGVDRVWPGTGVLYLSRLTARASKSRLSRVSSKPIYQHLTVRNWRTTTRLLQMTAAAGSTSHG